jgi:flagellar assembly factor FliW
VSRFATKYFGVIEWPDEQCIVFPEGIPGFETERRFARLEPEKYAPLIFLQSASTPELCFLAAPVESIDPSYELPSDSWEGSAPLEVLAILTVRPDGSSTANLLAPLLIETASGTAVQAIRPDRRYSCRHPLHGTPCGERLARCL